MKLMVVDDNKQVREGISLGIDWNEYGISKVRAYEDGAKARDDLVDYCPDIVIADIRMPNLDGLELLEEVRKENQKCRYILLSAYSEFEYAQKALRLGADDYILKPVKPRELVELVMKNITSLLEMQKESELYYEVYEKSFIHSILNGDEIENIKKFQEFMEKCLGLRFDEKRAVVGKIKIEQKNLISQKRPITEEETDKIKAILKTNKYISLVDKNNTFIMICPGCSSEMKNHIVAMEIKREFEKINQIFPELIIVVGISKSIGLGKLAEGWKEAEEALEQKYCYKTKVFFSFKEIYPMMKQAIPENLKKSYMEKILEAVKIKKKEDTQCIFKAIYEECREKNYSPREIKKFIEQLYFYLVRHMGMNSSREFEEEVLHGNLYLTDTIDKFEEYLFDAQNVGKTKEREVYSATIRNICTYVEEHFMETITVDALAEKFERTPNYISAKFKRETGKSFTDYLMEIRIQKAMNMLLYTNIPINEVARQTGFGSYAYFSRIFKKYTGKSAGYIRDRRQN